MGRLEAFETTICTVQFEYADYENIIFFYFKYPI